MMQERILHSSSNSVSIDVYAAGLSRLGTQVCKGAAETYWVRYEFAAMVRIPTFAFAPVAKDEARRILWRSPVVLLGYMIEPDEQHPANVWLYLCEDPAYDLQKLQPPVRRNIRRGLAELRLAWLTPDELLGHGFQAFSDTRARVGLTDGTMADFVRRFTARGQCAGHSFLGAWKDDKLAAFLSVTEVDDWAEIEGCFSRNDLLEARPNDTLIYAALSHYLTQERRRLVSYGASSVQTSSNERGLHVFKTKMGFQAKAVHRAFAFHPFLSCLVNRTTLCVMSAALRFFPGNRRLKKLEGVVATTLMRC
jgi:hypothetical protein